MKRISFLTKLIIFTFIPIIIFADSSRFHFEKGDAAYRDLDLFGMWGKGHAAIFYKWNSDLGTTIPSNSQRILEMTTDGLDTTNTIQTWINEVQLKDIWGSRGLSTLTRQKRNQIINEIMKIKNNQLGGAAYGGVTDNLYKDPTANNKNKKPTFRCDGLVEYIYEVVLGETWEPGNNKGLIENDIVDLSYFSPIIQYNSNRWDIKRAIDSTAQPPQVTVKDSQDNEIPPDGVTSDTNIKIYATDTEYGSGLKLLEIWKGDPNAGGTLFKSILKEYDIDHEYTSQEIGTLPEGEIYVRCHDQAGNDTLHKFTTPDDFSAIA